MYCQVEVLSQPHVEAALLLGSFRRLLGPVQSV